MDTLVWNNALNSPSSYGQNASGTASNLVRLVEDSDIKKNIEFDELSLDNPGETLADGAGSNAKELMGSNYPIIRINDVVLRRDHIKRMTISSKGFLPTIDLTFEYTNSLFTTRNMPTDGDIVSIFICTNTDALNYIRDDFIIDSCSANSANSIKGVNKIYLTGHLFIPGIDSRQNMFGFVGTSRDVMKDIAKRYNIGFAYNDPDDTDDYQNWICCNDTITSFVSTVTSHSWKDGTAFYNSWIDFYYNLCYVNVNKFLLKSSNEENEIDIVFSSNVTKLNEIAKTPHDKKEAMMSLKLFTNDPNYVKSPFHIEKWTPINNSSKISLTNGYQIDGLTFIGNQHIFTDSSSNCFDTTINIPAYDQEKLKDHIILRGRGKWEEGKNPDTDLRRVNYDYVNTYIQKNWTGVEYRMDDEDSGNSDTNAWSGNVHKNYNHAPLHNSINNNELNKFYIEIECRGLCLQVLRGERVPVCILHGNAIDSLAENSDKIKDEKSLINRFYSGFYVIDSLTYEYKNNSGGALSDFKTIMILKRREWPTPVKVEQDEETFFNAGEDA